ncbi:thump domain-containing protein 1-like [Plasmopara halstedii]|uniref:Thump domain-containing protein 1-like n=1 Tax=Plasmopara halstedii TaxID=4781 RepID=A0A0N7L534_PLAHL|nr:thump domain-containing protein 1-like [Plasmopara halstedii]CEG40363.1 thump domain-containing protein 1-like [Plasmopara halstedii]|eukprot:XP_024576732.1 thump domain-containing protein 1-like [Plasmopara halstedii]
MVQGSSDKRKKQWMSGRDGSQKRHKGSLASASNAKGHGAVLVTCDKIKERQSVGDALNILNEAADRFFPAKEEAEEKTLVDTKDDSIQKKLQEEIKDLQTQAQKRQTGRFTALDTGVKGVILIQFKDDSVSPTVLMRKIFEDAEMTKEFASRYIQKMIPLEKVGYSSVESIKELAAPMIEAHLEAYRKEQETSGKSEDLEFAVEIKRRNCTNLNSMDVINALVELVGDNKTKVNLTTPHTVLVVEVFRTTCGFSVLTNFHRFKKYNVRSVIESRTNGSNTTKRRDDIEEKSAKADDSTGKQSNNNSDNDK